MLQTLIHRFLMRRHFWRHATFGEIAELYLSRLMTVFALRFVMVFGSVYLYKLDYSLVFIALFWAAFYFLKVIFAAPSMHIVARVGPKHGLFIANVVLAVALLFLFVGSTWGVAAIAVWCVLQAFGGELNNLCYQVDFSKVKHADHAGKEIGYMAIIEKIASGVSPIVGGVVAAVFGPPSAVLLFAALFLASAVPLFKTGEVVRTHQKISIKGYPWRQQWRSLRASTGVGADIFASSNGWILFITIVVFAGNGNEIYAKIGALASIGVVVAMGASYAFGRLIDHRQGGFLLRLMVGVNALTHVIRPTITTPVGVLLTNSINDTTTTGYMMAYTRGLFDAADTPGYRIVHLGLFEVFANSGACLAALALAGLMTLYGSVSGLQVFFVLVGLFSLLIATPRFRLYQR